MLVWFPGPFVRAPVPSFPGARAPDSGLGLMRQRAQEAAGSVTELLHSAEDSAPSPRHPPNYLATGNPRESNPL